MKLAAVTVLLLAGCSQRVYSPPSQAFGIGPVTSIRDGAQTLDLEFASHAQVFDPGLRSGGARLTHGIGDRTEVSVEGTALGLERSGASTANGNIYAGRAGVRHSPGEDLSVWGLPSHRVRTAAPMANRLAIQLDTHRRTRCANEPTRCASDR